MKTNTEFAASILGYIPLGYILVCEECNNGAKYRTGMIYVDGIPLCGFKLSEVI